MDVVNLCKDSPAMVNEGPRVKKLCNDCGPTGMLTVYGLGLQECQKEFGDYCKYLNPKYASNLDSHRVVTHSNINDPNL
jgi:hypothetical protein